MGKVIACLRCGQKMKDLGNVEIQLGKATFFLPNYNHILAGALETRIYECNNCGKLEFFKMTEETASEEFFDEQPIDDEGTEYEQSICPNCKKEYDFYLATCPYCKYKIHEINK